MGVRDDKHAHLEQQIYESAIDLFCELGYKRTTLVDIAAQANVSTRTLYRYFPTKESILKRFCRENMVDLKSFAGSMDDSIPLKDKVLNVMAHDFSQMFCLFDPGYVLHYTRDDDGIINRFEIENLLELESVYCMLFRQEQMDHGIEPNISVRKCSSIIVAVYRHCNDIFRFKKHERYSVETIRNFYKVHVDIIWPSLYDELLSKGDKAKLGKEEEPFG